MTAIENVAQSAPRSRPRLPRHASTLIGFLFVCTLAIVLRVPGLGTIPAGMHGDEAAAGLQARRILHDGWIGVYSPAAGGNPTGYYYLAAVMARVFGEGIASVRLASAIIGVLTIAVLFIVVRRHFGLIAAVVAATLLAVSVWHRLFSRLGHVTITWPLAFLLALGAWAEATRTGSPGWWATAGALFAAGLYGYNGHAVLLVVIFVCIAAQWVISGDAHGDRLRAAGAFALGFGTVALPMLLFVASHPSDFWGRAQSASVLDSPEWDAASLSQRATLLARRYASAWDQLSFHPDPSNIDVSGVVPLIPAGWLALAGPGLAIALARRRRALVILAVVIIVIMPIVPALSAESAMRREFVVAPLFAMFAGIGASELIAMSARRSARLGAAMTAAVAIWIALIGYGEVRGFDLTIRSETARWTLGPEVVETARFLDTLPPESAVYFYSARWPLHHEVIEFLAPDVHGETRGQEYGSTSLAITGGDRDVVFVLLGDYQNLISTLAQKYPGGRTIEGPRVHGVDARPSYVAYAARAGD